MAQDDLYLEFLEKLKKDKSVEELAEYIAGLMKYGAAELYAAMFYFLEEEDLDAIEKITTDKEQEEEIKKRFQQRSGVTPGEFINNLRDAISKNFLFPELRLKNIPAGASAKNP